MLHVIYVIHIFYFPLVFNYDVIVRGALGIRNFADQLITMLQDKTVLLRSMTLHIINS